MNLHRARESRARRVPRTDGAALTHDFADVWPGVAQRLAAMLRRRGVSGHDSDEIVQETAARAVAKAVPFADGDDLFRWAAVVGWRLAIDARRRNLRLSEQEVPERADPADVASAAEHRIVLDTIRQRVGDLSARDQQALLSSFDDERQLDRAESVRLAVARHRARNRLRAMLDGLAAPVLGLWGRRYRFWSAQTEAIAALVVPTATCLLVITLGTLGPTTTRAEPSRPAPSAIVRTATGPTVVPGAEPVSATSGTSGAHSSGQPAPASPAIPPIVIHVDEPGGHSTEVGMRPKTKSDHLFCAQPPPGSAVPTTCIDSPISLDNLLP